MFYFNNKMFYFNNSTTIMGLVFEFFVLMCLVTLAIEVPNIIIYFLNYWNQPCYVRQNEVFNAAMEKLTKSELKKR